MSDTLSDAFEGPGYVSFSSLGLDTSSPCHQQVSGNYQFALAGNILTANEASARALGCRSEEIIGRHQRMFVFSDEANSAKYAAFWAKIARGEYDSCQYRRRARNGRRSGLRLLTIRSFGSEDLMRS